MAVTSYDWERDRRCHCLTACFTAQLLAAMDRTDLWQNTLTGWQTASASTVSLTMRPSDYLYLLLLTY